MIDTKIRLCYHIRVKLYIAYRFRLYRLICLFFYSFTPSNRHEMEDDLIFTKWKICNAYPCNGQ